MSDSNERVPNYPPQLQALIDSGYGKVTIHDHGDGSPITGFHQISLAEMEAMGEEERKRLGLRDVYEFALKHQDLVSGQDDESQ